MKILSLQKSYFTKLFATVLVVFFCATIVCTVFLYKSNYQQMTMEKEILNQSQIYSYRQNVDAQFDSGVSLVENCRNDTEFAEYAIGKRSDQQIYTKLAQYRFLFDNLGISVGVLNSKQNLCVMSDGYNKIDAARLHLEESDMSLNKYSMLPTRGIIPMKDGGDLDGAVFAIEQRYSNESTLLFLFTVYNINNLIIGERDNFIVRYENENVFMSREEAVPEWVFKMKEESKTSGGIAAYSTPSNSVLGITYYYITNTVTPQIVLQTTVLFFILLLIGLLLTVLIVRKLYNPIGQVVKKARTMNDSEYFDEMEFINQTVNMMQEDISKLRETDQKKMAIIRNKFVHDLCIGVITYDEAKQLIPEYSLDILTQPHFVVCVEIIAMGENYQDIDGEIYLLVKKDIVEMFIAQVFGDKNVCAVEFTSKRFGFIVGGLREGMKDRLNHIGQCLEREYDIDIIAGMGNTALDFAKTEQSYLEAVNIIENNFFAEGQYVGVIDDIKDIDMEVYYPFEIEQRIIESMSERKPEHAVNLMNKIFEINMNNGMNTTKWTEIRFLVMSTINRIINNMNETIESVLGEGIVLYLEMRTKKGAELKNTVEGILKQIGTFAKNGETEESEQLNRIISFIDDNLEHDISLTDLAEHLSLSAGYVSRLFKNIVKQNFKIYINQRRVERAKQILRERKNIKVSELAEMVGCNNTVTFTRIFKKYTGMTPGEYIS